MGGAGFPRRPQAEVVPPSRTRKVVGAVTAVVAALACTVLPTAARALSSALVQSGSLTMTSEAGDYIGQGLAYSYATPANVFFARSENWYGENNRISVTMRTDAASTDYWVLTFAAPPGESLTTGTYEGAVRSIWQGAGQPALDVWGFGRGCNTSIGTFTVSDAVFGAGGYVQEFHASFEQHCEGNAPALRGEVSVSNPPPPPPLRAQITIAASQLTAHGSVTLSGTVVCTRPIDPNRSFIQFAVSEPSKYGRIEGFAAVSLPSDCGPTPSAWQSLVMPADPKLPFATGNADATAWLQLGDPLFDTLLFQDPVTAPLALKEN
jgi:hypothetical protein